VRSSIYMKFLLITCVAGRFSPSLLTYFLQMFWLKKVFIFYVVFCRLRFICRIIILVIRVQSVKHYWRAVFRKVFVIAEILIVCSFVPKRDMDDWKLQARTVVRLEIKRNMFVSFLCWGWIYFRSPYWNNSAMYFNRDF